MHASRFSILIFMDRLAGAVIAFSSASCLVASTARTYAGVWRAFARWCGARGHLARPARFEIVAVYLVELRHRGRAVATIRRALGVIDGAHACAGLPRPTSAECVRAAWGLVRSVPRAPCLRQEVS